MSPLRDEVPVQGGETNDRPTRGRPKSGDSEVGVDIDPRVEEGRQHPECPHLHTLHESCHRSYVPRPLTNDLGVEVRTTSKPGNPSVPGRSVWGTSLVRRDLRSVWSDRSRADVNTPSSFRQGERRQEVKCRETTLPQSEDTQTGTESPLSRGPTVQ